MRSAEPRLLAVAARTAGHLAPLGLASRPVGTLDVAGGGHVALRRMTFRRAQEPLAAALEALRPAGLLDETGLTAEEDRTERKRGGGGRENKAAGEEPGRGKREKHDFHGRPLR